MPINDDDIPDDIPPEERDEYKRLRDEKLSALKKNSKTPLELYMRTEALVSVWKASVLCGNASLVNASLNDGFSPDMPVEDDEIPPLVSLCRLHPKTPNEARDITAVAECLIDHGATLNLRDRRGLLPADHALFSPHTALAQHIVLTTLRHNIARGVGRYFRPNYRAVFATIVSEESATEGRNILLTNIETIKRSIQDDAQLCSLPAKERQYWNDLKIPAIKDLPVPTVPLALAYQGVALLKKAYAAGRTVTKEDIESAEDYARMQETQHCQNFKPDYTQP